MTHCRRCSAPWSRAGLLYWLVGKLPADRWSAAAAGGGWDRRGFVIAATAAAAASTGAGLLGRALNGSSGQGAVASRGRVVLPRPASPAAPVPAAASLQLPGLSPLFTPNDDFYRVDTALVVPKVDAATWRLKIHGKGVTPSSHDHLRGLLRGRAGELIERDITLACVSNEVGGPTWATRAGSACAGGLLKEAGCARRRAAAPPTSWWPARWTA